MTAVGRAKVKLVRSLPDPQALSDAQLEQHIRDLMASQDRSARRWACPRSKCDGLPHQGWLHHHARAAQKPPPWPWSTLTFMAGRGGGKSRPASELVREWAQTPRQRIVVLAKKDTLTREICFEAPQSGLLAVIPPEQIKKYSPGTGLIKLTLTNGTVIFGFGAEVPDNIRGWAFDKAWVDEYAAWTRQTAQATWDMMWFCLREAENPQVVVSTTPKAVPHVRRLVKDANAAAVANPDAPPALLRSWHTDENAPNLSPVALAELHARYDGTTLGLQELGGVLLEDVEGALWQRWMFDEPGFRVHPADVPPMQVKVLALDPAASSKETADRMAFVVSGRSHPWDITFADQRPRGYVFHAEQDRMTPAQAVHRAAKLYHRHECDVVVVEANNGGEWIPSLFEALEPTVPVRIVHATRDKRARAIPVASMYEQGRWHHVGEPRAFDALEEQMTTYVGSPEVPGEDSPDLLDAAVWGAWALFLDPELTRGVETFAPGADARLSGRR